MIGPPSEKTDQTPETHLSFGMPGCGLDDEMKCCFRFDFGKVITFACVFFSHYRSCSDVFGLIICCFVSIP